MNERRRARKVYLTSKRAHQETMEMLRHMHEHQLTILERMNQMAGEIDKILAAVTKIKGKVTSMAALLNKLAQLIRDSAGDPAKLNAIADDLEASSTEAQTAIDANDDDPNTPPVDPPTDPVP